MLDLLIAVVEFFFRDHPLGTGFCLGAACGLFAGLRLERFVIDHLRYRWRLRNRLRFSGRNVLTDPDGRRCCKRCADSFHKVVIPDSGLCPRCGHMYKAVPPEEARRRFR